MLKSLHEARKMPNNCTPGNKMLPSRRPEGKASRLCRSVFVLLSNAWYRRTPTRRLCLFLTWGRSRCCSVPHWERLFLLPCVSSSFLPSRGGFGSALLQANVTNGSRGTLCSHPASSRTSNAVIATRLDPLHEGEDPGCERAVHR